MKDGAQLPGEGARMKTLSVISRAPAGACCGRPGPYLVIIGTLAVAIDPNTAVFSAFNNVVVKKHVPSSGGLQ